MSTPPPVPTPQAGMPTWLKWLLGLVAGCFVLVFACCVGSCLFGKALVGDLFSKFQHAEERAALARASSERVAALDIDFPPRIPEDVASAEINDDEILRYIRVRQALQAEAAEYQAIVDRPLPSQGGALGVGRGIVGMLSASLDAGAARGKLLEAAEPALRAQSMGPTDLSRLAEIVEWRFLHREEATLLGLPESRRREFLQMQMETRMLEAWTQDGMPPGFRINDRTREQAIEDLKRQREKLDAMVAEAEQARTLSEGTRALLEARRAELAALPAAGLQALAPLTAEPPLVGFVRTNDGFRVERRGGVGFGTPEPTAPAPEPEAPTAPEPPPAP